MSYLIVIDGPEGSGKSSIIEYLQQHLDRNKFVFTKDPGGSPACNAIRPLIVEDTFDYCKETIMLLYFASRAQLNKDVFSEAERNNKHIICDRYISSTYAYQGYPDNNELVIRMMERIFSDLKPIDYFIHLDVDPEIGLARSYEKAKKLGTNELRMENKGIEFFEKVRKGFDSFVINDLTVKPGNYFFANTNKNDCIKEVGDSILQFLINRKVISIV